MRAGDWGDPFGVTVLGFGLRVCLDGFFAWCGRFASTVPLAYEVAR